MDAGVLDAPAVAVDGQQQTQQPDDDLGFRPAKVAQAAPVPAGDDDLGFRPAAQAPQAAPTPSYDIGPLKGKPVPGLVQQGNIDVNHRPGITNADGSHSSIFSMTVPVNPDGSVWKGDYQKAPGYALVPSIANGRFLTPDGKKPDENDKKAMQQLEDAATGYYGKTRQHLGIFKSDKDANSYAGATHAYVNDGTDTKVYTPSYESDENGDPIRPATKQSASPAPQQPRIPGFAPGQDIPDIPNNRSRLSDVWDWMNQPMNIGHLRESIAKSEADADAPPTLDESLNHPVMGLVKRGLSGFGADASKMLLTPLSAALAAAGPIARGSGAAAQIARAGLVASSMGFGANAVHDAVKNGITPNATLGEKGYDDPKYLRRALGDAAQLTAGAAGVAESVKPTSGSYGARGVRVGSDAVNAEVGFRPAYRQPSPEGGYGEGSTVVPGKPYVRAKVGGKTFGGGPDADIGFRPAAAEPPAATAVAPKALPAPIDPVEGSKPVQTSPPAVPPEVTPSGRAAGEATASHPNMAPAMEQATNGHQPVGSEDPDTKRPIIQPTDNPAINQALATSEMPKFRKDLDGAVAGIPGATVAASRDAKNPERLAEKINQEGKPAETIGDYGAAQISVDSPEARDAVVDAIKAKWPVVTQDDKFDKGDDTYGYRNDSLQVQMPHGGTMEVQIVPKEVMEANPDQHKDYKAAREAKIGGSDAEFEKDAAAAKAKNDAAMEKFEARNAETKPAEGETKYKNGSTQANIPETSDAHAALESVRAKIADADTAGDGKDIGGNHVTVRYGIQDDETGDIEKYIRAQSPFAATLGKTSTFPPSKQSDGAAVIKADIEAPELHRLNAELAEHGNFTEPNFDYHPHATVAYVKPEAAQKYVGMDDTNGKTFPVRSIAITDRNGNAKEIPLEGGNSERKGDRGESPEPAAAGGQPPAKAESPKGEILPHERTEADVRKDLDRLSKRSDELTDQEANTIPGWEGKHSKTIDAATGKLVKGTPVVLPDGGTGTLQWRVGDKARVKMADGSRREVSAKDLKPAQSTSTETPGPQWIGVDLDGTLATYQGYKGPTEIGQPIPAMVDRVKQWLADGQRVKIFTARANDPESVTAIEAWSEQHLGKKLPVTNVKDDKMTQLWDDRAVQVGRNSGEALGNPEAAAAPMSKSGNDAPASQSQLAPGDVGRMPLSDLSLDPKRFQYKLNTDSAGTTNKLRDVPWNDTLAGVVSVWRDPADGKIYVVNGHHRYERAQRAGTPDIAVRMLPADISTANEARIVGAMQNIAEDNGTAIDAAKLFRDAGIGADGLAKYGVSLSGPTAEGGLALAKLDQPLFDDVVAGRIPERRGIAIANAAATPEDQEALVKLIAKAEAKGRTVTNATIEEMGRLVRGAGEQTTTQESLFGTQTRTQNLAVEKAEVSAYLRNQIAQERKLFAGLTSLAKAEKLGSVGENKINTEENKTVATQAEQAAEIYDRLSTRTGPVNDILDAAAKRLAAGENANTVKTDAYRSLRAALSETRRGGLEPGGGSIQSELARLEGKASAAVEAKPEASPSPAARNDDPVAKPTLPGMESAVAKQSESAAEVEAETQKEAADASLTTPKDNISRATGEMERNSPLFRDSEASGQGGLFGDTPVQSDEDVTKAASDLGSTFYSGLDPALFKKLFPDVAERMKEWLSDEPSDADMQKANMRETRGTMDRRVAVINEKLKAARKSWMTRPRDDSKAFWNAVESGKVDTLPPKDQALAKLFKGAFDQMKAELQQLKPEALRNYIENYFPHLWEKEANATSILKGLMTGKRPFAGKGSFLKKRTIPTMQDGLDLGLTPKTWNPVESFLMKYAEMAQFLMGHQTLAAMKADGTARFVAIGTTPPEGWTQIDDRIGTVYGNPNIPVTEYYDKAVYSALQETARNLLTNTTRKMKIGGTRLGYYSTLDGIVTKTGTPLDVMAHELGHAIDEIYGLKEQLVKDKRFKQELRDLADLRFEGSQPSDYYKKYVRKGEEKMAAIFQAFVHTPERFQEVAPNTYAHIQDFLKQHEELKPLAELKKSLVHEARQDTVYAGGMVTTGHYYSPAEAARVFNNFVSTGLAGRSRIYDTINWLNQNLNALQLGISAFHATTTTINAAASDIALGLEQLTHGHPIKAGTSFLKAPVTVINTLRNGSLLMREYLTPGSYAKMSDEARAIADAGGRIRQNTLELKPLQKIANAWRNGAVMEGVSAIPGAIIHAMVAPIMDYYVPRMKMGAFYSMAHDVLADAAKQGWTKDQTRAKMQRAWDSTDDRFGQVVYDNFFWHKAVRDVLNVTNRAVGWNFGSFRTYIGAASDTVRGAGRAASGEVPEFTPRMAFAIGSFMVAGLLGGLLTRLFTGKNPEEWKDYYYFKDADGTRHTIPGYPAQVISMGHDPVRGVTNKMAPVWSMMIDAIQNRDFYGTEIRHKDDPFMRQMLQFGTWSAKQAIPFSFSGSSKLLQKEGADDTLAGLLKAAKSHPGDLVLGNLGFQPAPAFIQHTPAMNAAREYEAENRSPGTRTEAQSEHSKAFQAVEDMYRNGKVDHDQIAQYRKEGKLPGDSVARAAMASRYSALEIASRGLSIEQILNVYEKADDAERRQLRPLVSRKYGQIREIPDEERREDVLATYHRVMNQQQQVASK